MFSSFPSLTDFPATTQPIHLAIGIFDGVHLGHQSVLHSCLQGAKQNNGSAGVLTFFPHPSRLFAPQHPTLMIQNKEMQNRLFTKHGLSFSIIQPFCTDFASIPAADFLPRIKQALPTLAGVYVGENFRFGKGRRGDVLTLVEEGKKLGISVISADRLKHNGEPISSTRIREALQAGRMAEANILLGYEYFSQGTITAGKQLGRGLHFPTVNLPWQPELLPAFGVYQVSADFKNQKNVLGVANYGLRPTVENDATTPLLEIHFSEDPQLSPGETIHVRWQSFLRPEKKFSSLDELKAQIAQDKKTVLGE